MFLKSRFFSSVSFNCMKECRSSAWTKIPAQCALTLGSFRHLDVLLGCCLAHWHFCCVFSLMSLSYVLQSGFSLCFYWAHEIPSGFDWIGKTFKLRCVYVLATLCVFSLFVFLFWGCILCLYLCMSLLVVVMFCLFCWGFFFNNWVWHVRISFQE